MASTIGRPRVARAYAWIVAVSALVVVAQGLTFAGFYSRAQISFLDAHGQMGTISGIIVLLVLTPLGFLSRFPSGWRMGWLTLALGILWNAQAHVFGYGIEDERTLVMVHIPVAFLVFGLALHLSGRTWRMLLGRGAKGQSDDSRETSVPTAGE